MKPSINIAKEFSRYPAGRYELDGNYNGEKFRSTFLVEPLKQKAHVKIIFDGARGYGSSFLEEAFGGLIRLKFSKNEILETFEFESNDDPTLPDEIVGYIDDALAEAKDEG